MKLTPKIISILNTNIFNEIESNNSDVGALIYSTTTSSSQIVFVESGEFRLIDNNKAFSSYTLSKENIPSLFGLSQLINASFNEEIRAISKCKYKIVNLEDLGQKQIELLTM